MKIILYWLKLLRWEIPSGMRAKLRTVAASNNRDHARNLSYCCLLALHIWWCYSSRTSRSWWIIQSTQHHRRGCNKTIKIHYLSLVPSSLCFHEQIHILNVIWQIFPSDTFEKCSANESKENGTIQHKHDTLPRMNSYYVLVIQPCKLSFLF